MFGVARNKHIDALRRGKAETIARDALRLEVLVLADADLERIDRLTSEHEVMRLVEALPADQRDAVLARIVEEQP